VIKDTLDIGAADVVQLTCWTIELRLFIVRDGRRYRLTVYDDNSSAIDTIDPGGTTWYAVDTNTGIARELVGYALRRAICRGLDTAEIVEDKESVTIDLKTFKSRGA
jgi:hypothetical protein